jgi:hypothetical protein
LLASRGTPCFGAGALDPGKTCARSTSAPVLPAPETISKNDNPGWAPYGPWSTCQASVADNSLHKCIFGNPKASFTVAMVGSSHTTQWVAAMVKIAQHRDIRIEVMTMTGCPFMKVPDDTADNGACTAWERLAWAAVMADHPDVLVTSNMLSASPDSIQRNYGKLQKLYTPTFEALAAAHIPTVVIRNDPFLPLDGSALGGSTTGDCVSANLDNLTACSVPKSQMWTSDPYWQIAGSLHLPGVLTPDYTDHICAPTYCDAVVGGVLVIFDKHHLSPEYAGTLAPYLERDMAAAHLLPPLKTGA